MNFRFLIILALFVSGPLTPSLGQQASSNDKQPQVMGPACATPLSSRVNDQKEQEQRRVPPPIHRPPSPQVMSSSPLPTLPQTHGTPHPVPSVISSSVPRATGQPHLPPIQSTDQHFVECLPGSEFNSASFGQGNAGSINVRFDDSGFEIHHTSPFGDHSIESFPKMGSTPVPVPIALHSQPADPTSSGQAKPSASNRVYLGRDTTQETQDPAAIAGQSESILGLDSQPSQTASLSNNSQPFGNAVFDRSSKPLSLPSHHSTTNDDHKSDESAVGQQIVIHPPMLQPYNQNQHTFVVENLGTSEVRDIRVEITVPENAKILAALPANSASHAGAAFFQFDRLAAGDRTQIHVTAISSDTAPIEFDAALSSRTVYSFDVHSSTPSGTLKNVSYNRQSPSTPTRVRQIPDRTQPGPVHVRNPYFQTSPNNRSASKPEEQR